LRNIAVPGEKATHDAAVADTPASPPTAAMPFDPNQNSNVVFSAVTSLNTRLTTLTRQGSPQKSQRIAYVSLDFSIIVDNVTISGANTIPFHSLCSPDRQFEFDSS
jgi:hypothetical protein